MKTLSPALHNDNVMLRSSPSRSQQPKTYPHPPIPVARLLLGFLCFPVCSSMWGNPEVGGGDNISGSYDRLPPERRVPLLAGREAMIMITITQIIIIIIIIILIIIITTITIAL